MPWFAFAAAVATARVSGHRGLLRAVRGSAGKGRDWLQGELKDSRLRGRGGAGFPLHFKWQSCREAPGL